MMRLRISALLMAAWCSLSYAQPGVEEPMIWLEPLSYQAMREMRDKARQMVQSQTGERQAPAEPRQNRANGGERNRANWNGQRLRRIYLRSGPFPRPNDALRNGRIVEGEAQKSQNVASGSLIWLERPDQTIQGMELRQRRSTYRADYPADAGGWYRIFAYNDLGVRDGSRVRLFSFYTFMSHGDEVDEKTPLPEARKGYVDGSPELELVRLYDDDEERYRNYVGSRIRLRALFRGEPLAGGRLSLTTRQGWGQTQTTDANGEAVFTLIKEDFHEDGVDRRKSELYLLRLEHRTGTSGDYQGTPYGSERYIATLPFRVSPAKDDWQSQRLAYLAVIITIVGAAVAISLRRRRGRRP
ncbi:MAG: DUF4198 domain-containing protein [Candidatus Thiodiazotropha sp. (ex Dulcina madagascariensis)]|nr:DUF4198 domain-containing protein [Candidatus Thiodiazotropha sp. (ex Dulcina madagascariensis)]MCU7926916.1 DUF4198 domain-containing protein [Candidatus Thiodiazotropha sp. (ex Dulcina madagascariensis)]